MKIDKIREMALICLYKIDKEDAFSNIALDELLSKNREKISNKDIGFISEVVYGTITWKLTIDYIIQKYSKIKIKKISPWIINIMRMAVYQIVFLDKIPKSAAVNEAVNLCKKYGNKSTGFVNSILRKIEKSDYEEITKMEKGIEKISLQYSMPIWIIEELLKDCNLEKVEEICKNCNQRSNVTIRINTLKTTKKELEEELNKQNIEFEESDLEDFLILKNVKNIGNMDLFTKGMFIAQDESAGLAAIQLNPKEGECVLDACSAPGGKTTYLAQIMKNNGKILAWDLYENRLNLVKENSQRLGIDIIETEVKDASKFYPEYVGKFDKILLDVPCLGIGVIKRKPEIKWKRKKEDIVEIKKIQMKILENCYKYLKHEGELIYSTCSILKEENDGIIKEFKEKCQKENIKIECENIKIYPDYYRDGFFISKIVINKNL